MPKHEKIADELRKKFSAGRARRRGSMRSSGLTLVELALVLAVMGLLFSLALGPLHERQRRADIRETEETLQRAAAALVAFAITHETSGVVVTSIFGVSDWEERIPSGRPYLPCPDVDGDGVEDRIGGGVVDDPLGAAALTLRLKAATAAGVQNGRCRHYKGLFPWRTVDGPEADKWGTHLTYRVDPNFSHQALGFDYATRAESLDAFAALADNDPHNLIYPRRPDRAGNGGADAPIAVCETHDCLADAAGSIVRDRAAFMEKIKSGLIITVTLASIGAGKDYRRGDFRSAPVFVLMSHGPNRLGGVPADAGACVAMHHRQDPHELQNAYYFWEDDPDLRHPLLSAERGCYTRHPLPGDSPLSEDVFVSRPPSPGVVAEARTMDDALLWMTAGDLALRLSAARDPPRRLDFLP